MNDHVPSNEPVDGADARRPEPGRGRLKLGVALGTGALAVGGLVAAGPLAGALQDDTSSTAPSTTASSTASSTAPSADSSDEPADSADDRDPGERRDRSGPFADLVADGTLTEENVQAIVEALRENRGERPDFEVPDERPTEEEREARRAEREARRAELLDTVFRSLVTDGELDQTQADAARAAIEDAPAIGRRGPGRHGPGRSGSGLLSSLVTDGTLTEEQAASLRELFAEQRPERPEFDPSGERPTAEEREAAREARRDARADALDTALDSAVEDGVIDDAEADAIRAKADEIRAEVPDRPRLPGADEDEADTSGD